MTTRQVLVTVGSDHHPFQRLVDWVDRWAERHPEVDVTVQYGTAAAPVVAGGEAYLEHARLQTLMADVDAIVTQGGPTGIVEARRHGRLPIVVPRRHDLGEHVDNHQISFSRFLRESGQALVAEDEAELGAHLDSVVAEPGAFTVDPTEESEEVAATVERFRALVMDLQPRHRFTRRATRRTTRTQVAKR